MKEKIHQVDRKALVDILNELAPAVKNKGSKVYQYHKTIRHLELIAFAAEKKEAAITEGRLLLAHGLSEIENFLWAESWRIVYAEDNMVADLWKRDFFRKQFVLLFNLVADFENIVRLDPNGECFLDWRQDEGERYIKTVRLFNRDDILFGWNRMQATNDDYRTVLMANGMKDLVACSLNEAPTIIHRLAHSDQSSSALVIFEGLGYMENDAKHVFTTLYELKGGFVSCKLAFKEVNLLEPLITIIQF